MFEKVPEFENCYQAKTKFGKDTYYLFAIVEDDRAWFSMSSGNKRKYKLTFEEKEYKSGAGLKALIWAKDAILYFREWYNKSWRYIDRLCIGASDNRRWKIYSEKLRKYGFYKERYRGNMILIKKY